METLRYKDENVRLRAELRALERELATLKKRLEEHETAGSNASEGYMSSAKVYEEDNFHTLQVKESESGFNLYYNHHRKTNPCTSSTESKSWEKSGYVYNYSMYNTETSEEKESTVSTCGKCKSKSALKNHQKAQRFIYLQNDVEVIKKLGSGQFGDAYVALLKETNQDVVLKVPKSKDVSDEMKRELMGLMNVAGQENIMQFIGVMFTNAGRECFLLEYCELGSLDSLHSKYDLTVDEKAFKIATGLFLGLAHLQMNKMIHRDIACRNLLVTKDWMIKIADFGLAVRAPKDSYQNQPKELLPWPWMAPETLRTGQSSFKSDVWAAGVTLWELLTRGKTPYADAEGVLPPFRESFLAISQGRLKLTIPPKFADTPLGQLAQRCIQFYSSRRPDALDALLYIPNGNESINRSGTTEMKQAAVFQNSRKLDSKTGLREYMVNQKEEFHRVLKNLTTATAEAFRFLASASNHEELGWRLIARQTWEEGGKPWEENKFRVNPSNPSAANYAILDELETFRGVDGKLELKLKWPGTELSPQHWKQTSNPYVRRKRGVIGYTPISCPHTSQQWGGVQFDERKCLLSGSINWNWYWYAVGTYKWYENGIPGPNKVVKNVELYVRSQVSAHSQLLKLNRSLKAAQRLGMSSNHNEVIKAQDARKTLLTLLLEGFTSEDVSNPLEKLTKAEHLCKMALNSGFDFSSPPLIKIQQFAKIAAKKIVQSVVKILSSNCKDSREKEQLLKRVKPDFVLVARQTSGSGNNWWTKDSFRVNPKNPEAANYAILDELERFRMDDGKFELKLVWPGSTRDSQHWRQKSNPFTKRSRSVVGYEEIYCPEVSQGWEGLQYDKYNALLSGSSNNPGLRRWWYSVGAFKGASEKASGFPGPPQTVVSKVELYVRNPEKNEKKMLLQAVQEARSLAFGCGVKCDLLKEVDANDHLSKLLNTSPGELKRNTLTD